MLAAAEGGCGSSSCHACAGHERREQKGAGAVHAQKDGRRKAGRDVAQMKTSQVRCQPERAGKP